MVLGMKVVILIEVGENLVLLCLFPLFLWMNYNDDGCDIDNDVLMEGVWMGHVCKGGATVGGGGLIPGLGRRNLQGFHCLPTEQ